MLYKRKLISSVQFRNDYNDCTAITKTVFEWIRVVFAAIIIFVLVFSFIFRISEVLVIDSNNKKFSVNLLLSSYGYYPCIGDSVAVDTKNGICTATLLAYEGQSIITYTENSEIALDYVLVNDKTYPDAKELEKIYGRIITIPDNCVMVIYDDCCSEKLCGTEIIRTDNIIGKVDSIVYPIEYLGKGIDAVKR